MSSAPRDGVDFNLDPTAVLVRAAAVASGEDDTESDELEYTAKEHFDSNRRPNGNQKQTKRGRVATRGTTSVFI